MKLPNIFRTASLRLTALYLLLFTLSFGVLFSFAFYVTADSLKDGLKSRVSDEINFLLFEYQEDGITELVEEIEERIEKAQAGDRLKYYLQNEAGKIIFDSIDSLSSPYGWSEREELLLFSVPLNSGYVLAVGVSLDSIVKFNGAMARAFGWTFLGMIMVGGAGGMFMSRRMLSRIDRINSAVRSIGQGKLSERLPLRGTQDEIDALAITFNQMLERIELLMNSARDVGAGIAHDLRTPLTRLRQKLETMRTGTEADLIADALKDIDGILIIFSALLRIAEVESGNLKRSFQEIDLSLLLTQLVEIYRPMIEENGGQLSVKITSGVFYKGEKSLLQQMFVNIIENAILHAGPAALVTLELSQTSGDVHLLISDCGPGIAVEQRQAVFKAFYRLDPSRRKGASGLGLSLVAAIANLHDIRVSLEDNQPGLKVNFAFFKRAAE